MVADVVSNELRLPLLMVRVKGASLDSSGYPPMKITHWPLQVWVNRGKVSMWSVSKDTG